MLSRFSTIYIFLIIWAILCSGCAPSGVASLVTVNGKHVMAASCSEERRLQQEIARVREERSEVTERLASARGDLEEIESRLRLSSVAEKAPGGGFSCRSDLQISHEKPPLALPEEQAVYLGHAACLAREVTASTACSRARSDAGSVLGFPCEQAVKSLLGADQEDMIGDLRVEFFRFLGDSALESGDTGPGMIAHGLAALYQMDAFQSCVGKVARASHDLYRVWSFQRQYAGREDQLTAVCESWRADRARALERLEAVQEENRRKGAELESLQQEHERVRADIDRWDLRCS